MRVLTCVGARPQFVKAAVLSAEFKRRAIDEVLVHSGQHYDFEMSDVFFAELALPEPRYTLGVGSANHGAQTGEMMRRLEPVALEEKPDWLLVYGDTNTTLAGALVGAKLGIPVAHVEAGLRSFDRRMPEEINRIVADHVAAALFAPNDRAAEQLCAEGITDGVYVPGDLMVDLAASVAAQLPERPRALDRFGVTPGSYGVATIHRAANTADAAVFGRLIAGLRATGMRIVFPVHPRTRPLVAAEGAGLDDNLIVVPPISYYDMIALIARAAIVFTDSGGIQKEAYVTGVPCVTLREETEWTETLEGGWNVLTGSDPKKIAAAARCAPTAPRCAQYGANAAQRIAEALLGREQSVEFARKRGGEISRVVDRSRLQVQFAVAGNESAMRLS